MSFFGNVDFQKLTNTEKAIYTYLRNNLDKIQYLHIRDIALEAHAGTSSVMRLVHKLGFSSYIDFKESIKKQSHQDKQQKSLFPIFCEEDFSEDLAERLEELADKVLLADQVIFTGVGASGVMCDYAARRFAGIGVNTFSFSDFTFPIASKLKNTANNLVIAISISGETGEVVEIVNNLSANKDVTIVTITPNESSTLAQLSDFVFSYRAKEHRVELHFDMSTQLPAVFLIEQLSELVYQKSK